jgi:arylsulfatase A-like enzyme
MNVLLIMEDALRPDHLGCYGYRKDTSPAIDSLARDGVVFQNAIATASHTLPPVVSLLTGQWSATHGVVSPSRFQQWISSPLWRDRDTPIKILARSGYCIDGEMVKRWSPLGFTRDTEASGIEEYFAAHRAVPWFFMAEPYPTHLPYNPPRAYFERFLDPGWRPGAGAEERLSVVRSCLIVHPSGLVSKLEAGEKDPLPDSDADPAHKRTVGTADLIPDDAPAVRALYDGEVRVFDDMVAAWVRKLEALGMLDDTVIVITADHGEELMERGHVGHCSCNLSGTLFDESIRVPLIIRYPRRLPRGKVVHEQVSQVDLMPTLFDLLGLPLPSFMEGSSTVPLMEGAAGAFREEAYAETTPAGWQALQEDTRELYCVRRNSGKLILKTDARRSHDAWEFYDVQADPGETNDLFPHHPLARPCMAEIESYVRQARETRM